LITMAAPVALPTFPLTVSGLTFRLPFTASRLHSAAACLPLTFYLPSLPPSAGYKPTLFVPSAQVEPHGRPWGWVYLTLQAPTCQTTETREGRPL
jgi:hypothetical protein